MHIIQGVEILSQVYYKIISLQICLLIIPSTQMDPFHFLDDYLTPFHISIVIG